MKKVFTFKAVFVLFFLVISIFVNCLAQKKRGQVIFPNGVKFHLLGLLYGNYMFQYDYFFNKRLGWNAGTIFIFSDSPLEYSNGEEEMGKFGYGGRIGFRENFLATRASHQPRGAYFEQKLKITYTNFELRNITTEFSAKESKIYFQFNLYLGVEVVILRQLSIDIFAGPGIGNGRLCFKEITAGNCERETEMFQGFFGLTGNNKGESKPMGIGMDGGLSLGFLF